MLASDAVLIGGFCPSFGLDTAELGGLQQGDQGKLPTPLLSVGETAAGSILGSVGQDGKGIWDMSYKET